MNSNGFKKPVYPGKCPQPQHEARHVAPVAQASKCPFNFSSSKTPNPRTESTAPYFAGLKCPFGKRSDNSRTQNVAPYQTQGQKTVSTGNYYDMYLQNKSLLVENNPHKKEGYPSTGFDKCPLAHLLQVNSDSEGERSNHSVEFEFETKEEDRTATKSFVDMQKASKKYELLHLEQNLKFRWKNQPMDRRSKRCPFSKKAVSGFISAFPTF
jgi:hypothetical protein